MPPPPQFLLKPPENLLDGSPQPVDLPRLHPTGAPMPPGLNTLQHTVGPEPRDKRPAVGMGPRQGLPRRVPGVKEHPLRTRARRLGPPQRGQPALFFEAGQEGRGNPPFPLRPGQHHQGQPRHPGPRGGVPGLPQAQLA